MSITFRFVYLGIVVLMVFSCSSKTLKMDKKLNVLIVTDERKFNREAFFEVFDSFEDIQWKEMKHPIILDFFGTDSIHYYDAIVFYDMPELVVPNEQQKKNMLKFFKSGAPAIFLHHSILSYRHIDDFFDIIGGRYYGKVPLIKENGDSLVSTYQHDVSYKIRIEDKNHPITKGLQDFEIFDETYNNYLVKDNVKVLLSTDHPLSGSKLAWINQYGKSEIIYLINGHDENAYQNPNFRRLLHNSIKWVARK